MKYHAYLAIVLAAVMLLSLPAAAHTPEAPRAYAVSSLPKGESLNVRLSPSSAGEDIGDLPMGAAPIEVIETDPSGRWGRILWQGANAWVSMRYLEPVKTPIIEGTKLPSGLSCAGTEPFWHFVLSQPGSLRMEMLGADEPTIATLEAAISSVNGGDFPVALLARSSALEELTAILRPARCNDGMSDQTYGWSVDLLRGDGATPILLSGCCRLPLPE